MKRKIKLKRAKLGKQLAWGMYSEDTETITLDTRLVGKKLLSTAVHEALHASYPDLSESQILHGEQIISDVLWRLKIHPVSTEVKQPNDPSK